MKPTFDPAIEACLQAAQDNFHTVRTANYQEYRPYCEQLFAYAAEEQSDYLFAKAYYYMMEYYATDNDHINTISCALEGIKYQQNTQEYELVARSYNILGIFTSSMGDSSKAVDYFLSSIDFCNKYHCDHVHAMATANLADVFHRSLNYNRALFYYEEAEKYYIKEKDILDSCDFLDELDNLLCNKGHCLLSINQLDEANECGRKIKENLAQIMEKNGNYVRFTTHVYLAALAYANKDMEEMQYHFRIAQDDFHSSDAYTSYLSDIKAYIGLYMDLKKYDEAVEVLEYYLQKCHNDRAPFYIYSIFLERRIECTLLLQDDNGYRYYSQLFIKLYEDNGVRNSEAVLHAETAHKEQQRIQKLQQDMLLLNEQLMVQSQHDALTGLPNRAYLNNYAEETLTKALKNHTTFGIEILDIDFFKSVNDTYGHIEGDHYLTAVADLLYKITEEYKDVFAARYGGDEFVLVYYNKTLDEVNEIMEQLKQSTNSVKLPETSKVGVDHVTLSQGCCNRVPEPMNRLWDYLSCADNILYEVKKKGKNNYKVSDRYKKAEV